MGAFVSAGIHLLFILSLGQGAAGGIVSGTARDGQTHHPLPDLVVSLTDLGRATLTDSAGKYVFADVPSGIHQVATRRLGFAPRTLRVLVPQDGVLELNIALEPVEMRLPPLVVRQSLLARGTHEPAGSSADRTSTTTEARNDPRFTEPDVLQTLAGGDVVVRQESPSGMSIRGGAPDQVAYALDGVPVFSPYHAAGLFSAWNPDAISSVALSASVPSPGDASALSGTVAAETREPGNKLHGQGAMSTTHGRVTVDGPLGIGRAGFLLSLRSGLPSLTAPRNDASYVRGESDDVIAKLETPAFGGRLRVLRYDSENEINTQAAAGDAGLVGSLPRNAFAWTSRSVGAEWDGTFRELGIRTLAWRASSDAGSTWNAPGAPLTLAALRRDDGFLLAGTRTTPRSMTTVGVRAQSGVTHYVVNLGPDSVSRAELRSRTLIAAGFLERENVIGDRTSITAGASVDRFGDATFVSPRAQLRRKVSDQLSLAGSYGRLHQFAQSLRNEESIAGTIFPADLYLGAGHGQLPVARSDQGVLSADYRPLPNVRLAAQAYARRIGGALLVAPFEPEPFVTRGFGIGRARAQGVSLEGSLTTARLGILARYGLQDVTYTTAHLSYSPGDGTTHTFQGGAIVFPTPSLSLKLGLTGEAGRRATDVAGPFEWDACSLRDRGCEFSGTPRTSETIGGTPLPFYARADIGARKEWHPVMARRQATVALFGAVTNVFGRRNLLTFASEPTTGVLQPIPMRPFAPLVVGLDWSF